MIFASSILQWAGNIYEKYFGFVDFIIRRSERVVEYTANHFSLVITVMFFSLILWISVGLLISRYEKLANTAFGIGNILFVIPSISLFGIFITIPMLGLGRTSAALALILYAMMPMVRNVYRGIKSVEWPIIEAGRGMGMSPKQILFQIQIPIAWPIIFAGIRVTTVMITGIATVATFIGERNLGRFIHHGIARESADMIIAGAVLVSVIAILLDYILGKVEYKITSPGLRKEQEQS